MRVAELVKSCHCLIFDFGLAVSCLVRIFTHRPVLFVLGKVFLNFVRLWEPLQRQHDVGRNEEEGVCRDRVACSLRLFLRILECINLLGDALHV